MYQMSKSENVYGAETRHIFMTLSVISDLKYFFQKWDEKNSLDPKMSDLVKFSKLSCLTCLCGSITLCSSRSSIIMPMYPITHVPHCPCAPSPMWPIAHVMACDITHVHFVHMKLCPWIPLCKEVSSR